MTIAEIIFEVRVLSRSDTFQIARLLLDDLAKEELPAAFANAFHIPVQALQVSIRKVGRPYADRSRGH
jgi:hypothetical protein